MRVATVHLEQTDPGQLRAAAPPAVPVSVVRAELPSPELNRYLYTAVGGDLWWLDRLSWSWQRWHDWLDRPGVETWVASVRGTPVGYAELDGAGAGGAGGVGSASAGAPAVAGGAGGAGSASAGAPAVAGGEVELAYFGLLPAFVGQRIGGHLLTVALQKAWSLAERWPGFPPTRRVWVHTCSLDGEAALPNYWARGMRTYRMETGEVELPATSPGPWASAARPPVPGQ